ncbi:MAG: hypothetical protein KIH08_12780 [Candidatus Freyarchaeota archaeon]|nr:hypothetical protein [Candidatus Jordarchaeia archaeon]
MKHGIKGRITIVKNDKTLVDRPIKSFVRNAHNFIANLIGGCGLTQETAGNLSWNKYSLVDETGATKEVIATASPSSLQQYGNPSTFFHRIAIGLSGQAWSYEDYNLIQFYQNANAYSLKTHTTNAKTTVAFQGLFHFTENQIISEVGLFGKWGLWCDDFGELNPIVFLVSRDVLTPPLEVVVGDTIAVIYTIEVS